MNKIYITRKLPQIAKELLSNHFLVEENLLERPLSQEELSQALKTNDGVLTTFIDRITHEMIKAAPNLKALSNYAIGLDNIDTEAARVHGVAVYNLPDIVTNSTADLTFAILLSLIRKIPQAKEYVQKGNWSYWTPDLFLGEELFGKKIGIIGYGRTGKAVIQRALGFGLDVLVYHHSKVDFPSPSNRIKQVSWAELLSEADYLSFHVPLTTQTRFMCNKSAFDQMKKRPLIINVSRGAVIQPDDLVVALESGQVRGAALDVTFPEPLSHHHPLCQMENCLIVPHIGSATQECRYMMAKKAAENLISHFYPNG